jgi:hypothetical protein
MLEADPFKPLLSLQAFSAKLSYCWLASTKTITVATTVDVQSFCDENRR